MIDRKPMLRLALSGAALAVALLASACNGGSKGGTAEQRATNGALLTDLQYGRLVDVYAYRRENQNNADRRDVTNRRPVLVQEDVVIDPGIETEALIDAEGNARPDANYRFLPFDPQVGHPELMILWDDQADGESERFDAALAAAREGLQPIQSGFRGQNTAARRFTVVPRDAAIVLTFNADLGVQTSFLQANPEAVQLLRLSDAPGGSTAGAIQALPARLIARGNTVVVDPTIEGGETGGVLPTSNGLPPSLDQTTANIRIALPIQPVVAGAPRFAADSVPQFNDIGLDGQSAVIRDFRAAQVGETGGVLPDGSPPSLVASKTMGITAVNGDLITINKRNQLLAIRGRIPFVDGGLDPDTLRPLGVAGVPTVDNNGNTLALPSGDLIVQTVTDPITGETFRLRAEVLEVVDVIGNILGVGPTLGLTANGTDGGELERITVRVDRPTLLDADGNVATFANGDPITFSAAQPNGPPENGQDCTVRVRYYEFLRYNPLLGDGSVSDADRRDLFVEFDPVPGAFNGSTATGIDPFARVSLNFSEAVDLNGVSTSDNLMLTNRETGVDDLAEALGDPKRLGLTLVASRLSAQEGNGSRVEVSPAFGFFHEDGNDEEYWLHVLVGDNVPSVVTDRAGNPLNLFDERPQAGSNSFSIRLRLEPTAPANLTMSRVLRFASVDEDGTDPAQAAADYFGQFQIRNGTLVAAATTRRRLLADSSTIAAIDRFSRGECVVEGDLGPPPMPPMVVPPPAMPPATPLTGLLYTAPAFSAVQLAPPRVFQPPGGPQPYGGVTEPMNKRGSRMMLTYREDDFALSYTDPADFNIDVEQMHWASWNNEEVLFDRFSRVTMALAHSEKRPDFAFEYSENVNPPPPPAMGMPQCNLNCKSLFSGLSTTYLANVLNGSRLREVVQDAPYEINPGKAFISDSQFRYHPYPEFADTYTWRDSRLVRWDSQANTAIGLGGAQDAAGAPADSDATASISSPWIPDDLSRPAPRFIGGMGMGTESPDLSELVLPLFVRDQADFLGDRTRDHDPIALPLLVDLRFYPEPNQSGNLANAGNEAQMALAGDYYNIGAGVTTVDPFACTNIPYPAFRIHKTGGFNPNTGQIELVQPDTTNVATPSIIKNMGLGDADLGLVEVPPGDPHLHWAAMDVVRRVSLVTGGFFDTLVPAQNDIANLDAVPDLSGRMDLEVGDFDVIVDPPLTEQPAGTGLTVEFRGAATIPQANIYAPNTNDEYDLRGNLLNPNYACEAYRYASPNLGLKVTYDGPRVEATGLTNYARFEELDQIRTPAGANGALPRFMNFRLVLENNIRSNPAASPFLRSMAIVYRLRPAQ